MRLEGQSKLGYFPTPTLTLNLLKTWLAASSDGSRRYLDPCCGQGEALAEIANPAERGASGGHGETYGIELSDARANAAQDRLAYVLNTAYEYAVLTPETFSLLWLNPPYDGESTTGGGKRMEETFLCDLPTTDALIPGGVLVYIIPHARINERIARHLAGWYTDLRCFKLPAEEYQVFKQVVILGVKRSYVTPEGDLVRNVLAWHDRQCITPSNFDGVIGWRMEEVHELLPSADGKSPAKKTRQPILSSLPELTAGNGAYTIPPTPLKGKGGRPFRFQYQAVSDEDFQREAEDCAARLDSNRAWLDLVPSIEPPKIEPAMTPKKGHIAMQVSGGLLGTNRVTSLSGKAMLLKGNVDKIQVCKPEANLDEEAWLSDGQDDDTRARESLRKVEMEEQFRSILSTLTEDGTLITLTNPAEIGHLLEQYVGQLADIVQARNVPQYDMKPEPWEWAVFDPLSKSRRLPGRNETGLTDFQKHLAIALGRLCLKHRAGFANSEMGTGKTTIGIALTEYIRVADERKGKAQTAYPAMVVGPGIVTGAENWPKEVVEVTPGAQGKVVVVGAKPLPKPAKIGAYLASLGLTLDEATLEGKPAVWVMNSIRRAAKKQKATLSNELVSALQESLERAEQNPPARRKAGPERSRRGAKAPNLLDGRIGGFKWLGIELPRDSNSEDDLRGKYSLAQFIAEYRSGALPQKSFAIVSYETAKLGSGRVPALNTKSIRVRYTDEDGQRRSELKTVCTCPTCGCIIAEEYDEESGEPLDPVTPTRVEQFIGLKRRYCQAPAPRWLWDADKGKHVLKTHDEDGHPYVCGSPLFENSALRRIPAAEYAKKKAKGIFGLCLVDECHKGKAKGTGVGQALTALVNAARYTVGLTGTLMGGYSTSIFWLLYRFAGEVRQHFGFNDERRWTEKYGLLKRTFYTDSDAPVADDGAFTGTKFFETVSEKPGISPAIAGIGLKYCTFSSLKDDAGLPLPSYSEEIVRLTMTEAMREQYAKADGSGKPPSGLFKWALDTMEEETGKGAISVWLNTALNRPDAMFRPETVTFNRRLSGRGRFAVRQRELVSDFEPVIGAGEWLPKETWMAEQALAEYRQGRKTLVYVRQTGGRDVQPRLQECLTARGLRVGILRPSLAPEKRATWIKRHVNEFDVLLTNARLVETGLNLTMFSTGIFFELEWSLYCLWQAMRRLYRPGAPKPVKLYFPVYAGTLEEAALDLIGAKMMAAQVFYGDAVQGALVEEGDEGNLLNDIVRRAMGELQVGRVEGIFSSTTESDIADAPFESPITAIGSKVVTLADLWARRREFRTASARQRKLNTEAPLNQMTLF